MPETLDKKLVPHDPNEPTDITLPVGASAIVMIPVGVGEDLTYKIEAYVPAGPGGSEDKIEVGPGFYAALMLMTLHGSGNEDLLLELDRRWTTKMAELPEEE